MYHIKLADICKSKRLGEVILGALKVRISHDEWHNTVIVWQHNAGTLWPYFRSASAQGNPDDTKSWEFADTVDVYIDETTGRTEMVKDLKGNGYWFQFLNDKGAPLTLAEGMTHK